MVLHEQPDLTAEATPDGAAARSASDDLAVEPVETVRGDAAREDPLPPAIRIERLRRLALQLRVATLQAELRRADRRRQRLIEQYEQVLAEREAEESRSPFFSWLDRS